MAKTMGRKLYEQDPLLRIFRWSLLDTESMAFFLPIVSSLLSLMHRFIQCSLECHFHSFG